MLFSCENILLITVCLMVLVGAQVRWQAIARRHRAHSGADLDRLSASDPTTPTVTTTRFS
jgi:hypothetical protein